MDVGPAAVDLQPGSAVENAGAPAADLEDLARPADVTQRLRVESPAVVDGEVPVAVRAVRAFSPRTAQRDCLHAGQSAETAGDVRGKGVIVHTRTLTATPAGGTRFSRARLSAGDRALRRQP